MNPETLKKLEQCWGLAEDSLNEFGQLPKRIDEMTDMEVKIAYMTCDLFSTLRNIKVQLEEIICEEKRKTQS